MASTSLPITSAVTALLPPPEYRWCRRTPRRSCLCRARSCRARNGWRPKAENIRRRFEARLHARGGLRIRARDEHVVRVFEQAPGNGDNLLRGLAFAEDHLRHAVAQRAMVVHLGEAQIFERHVAQAVQRAVHIHRAARTCSNNCRSCSSSIRPE
jgi:hypothetical protein